MIVIVALVCEAFSLKKRLWDDAFSEHSAEALGDKIVLDQLRETNAKTAIELLEMNLDSEVLILCSAPKQLGSSASTTVNSALESIKEYRQRNPRKRESRIDGIDDAAFEQIRSKTTSLLSNVK